MREKWYFARLQGKNKNVLFVMSSKTLGGRKSKDLNLGVIMDLKGFAFKERKPWKRLDSHEIETRPPKPFLLFYLTILHIGVSLSIRLKAENRKILKAPISQESISNGLRFGPCILIFIRIGQKLSPLDYS